MYIFEICISCVVPAQPYMCIPMCICEHMLAPRQYKHNLQIMTSFAMFVYIYAPLYHPAAPWGHLTMNLYPKTRLLN